jgi:hypothetical protein
MKKLAWSAAIGSGTACALYWTGRLSRSSGPPSSFSVYSTMFFLMPGYYFLAAVGLPNSASRLSQKIGITLMIVFDCVFWSFVVLLMWGLLEKIFETSVTASRK